MIARRAASAALIAALLVGSGAAAGCSMLRVGSISRVIQPTIKPSTAEQGTDAIAREWQFEGDRVRIDVPVDRAVLAGAKTAEKRAIFLGDAPVIDWVPEYYRAFISESHQEAFFSAMLKGLHEVRQRERMDDARYVELVTTMAQALEYRIDPGELAPKFPIQTYGDGFGDCDDKTLLAAALLSRDGYDVSVFLFRAEQHVAMGIRAPGLDYKGTGYAYAELTSSSLVGIAPEELAGGIRLTSQPEVIKIGQGELVYTAGEQAEFIERRLAEVRAAEKAAQEQIARDQAEFAAESASLNAEREAFEAITDPARRAEAIRAFNEHVRKVNDLAAEGNERVARYNALVEAERYVIANSSNRPGVYKRLRAVKL